MQLVRALFIRCVFSWGGGLLKADGITAGESLEPVMRAEATRK